MAQPPPVGVRSPAASLHLDRVALLVAVVVVALGLALAHRGDHDDLDQRTFTQMVNGVQEGGDYYSVTDDVLADTYGVRMANARAYRLPTLYLLLSVVDEQVWVLLAAVPSLALVVGASLLAGPDAAAQRLAAVLAGLWVLAALPGLHLYSELWAGPFLLASALLVRHGRERAGALAALVGALVRELLFAGLAAGIVLALIRRRPLAAWVQAAAVFLAAMLVHLRLVAPHLDPDGGIPALGNAGLFDWLMISPGTSPLAVAAGPPLVALAFWGLWLRRHDPAFALLSIYVVPMVVLTLVLDRGYWALTWCGATSAAAAVAVTHAYRSMRPAAPYPRH